MSRRVVVLRGTAANPWDLTPWQEIGAPYDVDVVIPTNNQYDVSSLGIHRIPIATVGARLSGLPLGAVVTRAVGERYIGLEECLRGADIVHAAELGYWFTAQAARLRQRLGFRLVVTAWETLPLLDAYRNVRTRAYRRVVLRAADRFLATTERAREALLLEGAEPERIRVTPPGIDLGRFAIARAPAPPSDGSHLLLSIGRLVWEKGHQDLLRAVALLRDRGHGNLRVLIIGVGPEEARLRGVARDLRLEGIVELRGHVPYEQVPALYARASALVLASLSVPFWEEQFGMVLAEAMAGHVPVVAAASGAIPEVVGGSGTLFSPGDWIGLAQTLAQWPLNHSPIPRREPEPDRLERFSCVAGAARLRSAYDDL